MVAIAWRPVIAPQAVACGRECTANTLAFVDPRVSPGSNDVALSFDALSRRGVALRLHFGGVVAHQGLGDTAGREFPVADFSDGRHLGGRAGDEAFGEA